MLRGWKESFLFLFGWADGKTEILMGVVGEEVVTFMMSCNFDYGWGYVCLLF